MFLLIYDQLPYYAPCATVPFSPLSLVPVCPPFGGLVGRRSLEHAHDVSNVNRAGVGFSGAAARRYRSDGGDNVIAVGGKYAYDGVHAFVLIVAVLSAH